MELYKIGYKREGTKHVNYGSIDQLGYSEESAVDEFRKKFGETAVIIKINRVL